MTWVAVDVALAVAGLALLTVLGWRLWRQVRTLGREVHAAGERIRTAAATLDELGGRARSVAPGGSGKPPGVA